MVMNKVLQILVVLTFPIWFPIVVLFNALFSDGDSFDKAFNEMQNRTNGDEDE